MSGRVRASPARASSTTRGALRSVIGTLLQLEQFVDVAHEFVLLVRLAEVALDADIHRALAVLLAGTRGDHHDRHVPQARVVRHLRGKPRKEERRRGKEWGWTRRSGGWV